MNYTTEDPTRLLQEEEWQDFAKNEIPSTMITTVTSVVGFIGNTHAFVIYLFYYGASNRRTFILWLSAADLLACVLIGPYSIYISYKKYTHTSAIVCKFFNYCNLFLAGYSLAMLDAIAIERYHKIGRSSRRQLTPKETHIVCGLLSVVGLGLAIPAAFIGDVVNVVSTIHGLNGTQCVYANFMTTTKGQIYLSILVSNYVIFFGICFCHYYAIWKILRKRRAKFGPDKARNMTASANVSGVSSSLETAKKNDSNSDAINIIKSAINLIDMKETIPNEKSKDSNKTEVAVNARPEVAQSDAHKDSRDISKSKTDTYTRGERKTLIFIVASVISYTAYMPYFIYAAVTAFQLTSQSIGVMDGILKYCFLMNNAINPLVYCFMDEEFRMKCKNIYNIKKLRCEGKPI